MSRLNVDSIGGSSVNQVQVVNTLLDLNGNTVGAADPYSGQVIQKTVLRSTTTSTLNTTSFTEASSNYRVSITPKYANSRIHLYYHVQTNMNGSWSANVIFQLRTRKYTSGSGASVTSQSTGLGSRLINDFGGRPGNGYDGNDQFYCYWTAYDIPGTTATQTYGFDYRRETGGTGTQYFGYSAGDNSNWGIHSPIIIIAEEVYQ